MTWQQFVRHVENKIRAAGIDPDKQPVEMEFSADGIAPGESVKTVDVDVDTREMPKKCSINIW